MFKNLPHFLMIKEPREITHDLVIELIPKGIDMVCFDKLHSPLMDQFEYLFYGVINSKTNNQSDVKLTCKKLCDFISNLDPDFEVISFKEFIQNIFDLGKPIEFFIQKMSKQTQSILILDMVKSNFNTGPTRELLIQGIPLYFKDILIVPRKKF